MHPLGDADLSPREVRALKVLRRFLKPLFPTPGEAFDELIGSDSGWDSDSPDRPWGVIPEKLLRSGASLASVVNGSSDSKNTLSRPAFLARMKQHEYPGDIYRVFDALSSGQDHIARETFVVRMIGSGAAQTPQIQTVSFGEEEVHHVEALGNMRKYNKSREAKEPQCEQDWDGLCDMVPAQASQSNTQIDTKSKSHAVQVQRRLRLLKIEIEKSVASTHCDCPLSPKKRSRQELLDASQNLQPRSFARKQSESTAGESTKLTMGHSCCVVVASRKKIFTRRQ